jgi:hypothetical protein
MNHPSRSYALASFLSLLMSFSSQAQDQSSAPKTPRCDESTLSSIAGLHWGSRFQIQLDTSDRRKYFEIIAETQDDDALYRSEACELDLDRSQVLSLETSVSQPLSRTTPATCRKVEITLDRQSCLLTLKNTGERQGLLPDPITPESVGELSSKLQSGSFLDFIGEALSQSEIQTTWVYRITSSYAYYSEPEFKSITPTRSDRDYSYMIKLSRCPHESCLDEQGSEEFAPSGQEPIRLDSLSSASAPFPEKNR